MKLYPRKLHSVAELKAEKQKILQLHAATDKEEWFSVDDLFGKKGKSKKKAENTEDTEEDGIDFLSIATNLLGSGIGWESLLNIGLPYLSKITPRIKPTLFKVSKEVLFGYAKWKAVETGFHILKNMLRRKDPGNKKYHKK